jgi:hypothetical protein
MGGYIGAIYNNRSFTQKEGHTMPAQRTQQDKLMPVSFPTTKAEQRAASSAAAEMHIAAFRATKATQTGRHSKQAGYQVTDAFAFRTSVYDLIADWGIENVMDAIEDVRKNAAAWSQSHAATHN